ncbi:NAD-dependent alcohol dehydrogenase [Fusarium sp. NRRL 25303]|nr:NAD-dependent alcohol dehydrogenase [Fusarium sp. NRRL 25303]
MAKRLVLAAPFGRLQLDAYDPAHPGPTQIQVKVLATSLNHLDWKRIKKSLFIPCFPHVLGMDIVGHVVDPGESQRLQEGDLIVSIGTVGLVMNGKINSEIPVLGLSTLPFSLCTAACGLYLGLGLAKVTDRRNVASTHVLIWVSANGGVGKLAVQLAKISGYSVVAVTSSNETTAQGQARGADYAFARSDPDLITKIKSIAPDLRLGFDTVVTEETISQIVDCCQKPATVATAIKYTGAAIDGVHLNSVYSGEIMGKTMADQASATGVELSRWLWGGLDKWLGNGQITPLELEALNGLQEVQEGLDRLENGTVHKKLVTYVT